MASSPTQLQAAGLRDPHSWAPLNVQHSAQLLVHALWSHEQISVVGICILPQKSLRSGRQKVFSSAASGLVPHTRLCEHSSLPFKLINVYDFFREGKGGRKRGRETVMRERSIDQLPLVRAPAGDRTCNLGTCPDREWNQRPFALRDDSQPTEPRWCGRITENYSAMGNKKTLPLVTTQTDPEDIMLSEVSQRQTLYDLTCTCNLDEKCPARAKSRRVVSRVSGMEKLRTGWSKDTAFS